VSWFGLGAEIVAPIKTIADGLDELFTSDEERAQAQIILEKFVQEQLLAQSEINKQNANSGIFFHSGWRPAAGWVCVFGLFYYTVGAPVLSQVFGMLMPDIHASILLELLGALLGLGCFRTLDKSNASQKKV
jgi:hypothetical protein